MGNQISFSVTETELQRQIAGEADNLSVDPRGKADAIMVVTIGSIYFVNLLATLYLLWNRRYPPLKSKNPMLMTLIMISLFLWFVGDLQANGHVTLANSPMTNCKGFGLWMRLLLGVCGMLSLVALRAYGLYRIFYLHRPYHGLGLYMPFFVYYLCVLVYGIVAQALKPAITTHYIAELDICTFHPGFKATLFALLWVSLLIVVVVHWRIRKIKSSFNESREMMVSCVISSAVLMYVTIMHYLRPLYPLDIRQRIVATSLEHFAANVLWWAIMSVPMYNCLFNRHIYLNHWIHKLRRDGLQKEYDVDSDSTVVNDNGTKGLYSMRNTLLMSGSKGNKKDELFYAMDDSVYGSKAAAAASESTTHIGVPYSLQNTNFVNETVVMERAADYRGTDGAHTNNLLLRSRSILQKPKPLSQYVDKFGVPTINSDRHMAPPTMLQPYTLISFPEDAVSVKVHQGIAHDVHLEDYNFNERYLI
ncbi:hypothetical protein BX661DRAFT_222450 [Kickxella alabastrina]|uniref:uncharacterized protein n=1 Tax=Kickxella alabastrina TaxID=61397 RepID=UPI00222062C0|nr:uncharacterized protein BX661DRAFT_222450 [Kickxella alabastrina]KAI7833598.1 hypothetical protein BX661DRAFT_222450 [Kickxella alabastrina]